MPFSVSRFIANRLSFHNERSLSRFIIRLSIGATALSVAVMIIALSFINGFQTTISNKVFSFFGHIRIQQIGAERVAIAEELPIAKNDTVEKIVRSHPEVVNIQAFATRYGVIRTNSSIEGVLFKGVDSTYQFQRLGQFLQTGRWPKLSNNALSNEIVLSSYTANQLQAKVGDKLIFYFLEQDAAPRPRPLTLVGLYKTGIEEYDKSFALGDIQLLRKLNNWQPNEIGGYEVFLRDYQLMDTVSMQLFNSIPLQQWNTRTIKEIYQNIFDWLNIQNTTKWVALIIMIIVAVINLISCLIILVLERYRMVGLLKALGAQDIQLQGIFIRQAAIIAVGGIGLGVIIALFLCWLQQITGFIQLDESAYYMKTAAVLVNPWQVLLICIATFLICMLSLLLPTYLIKRLHPIKAISFR